VLAITIQLTYIRLSFISKTKSGEKKIVKTQNREVYISDHCIEIFYTAFPLKKIYDIHFLVHPRASCSQEKRKAKAPVDKKNPFSSIRLHLDHPNFA